MTCREDFSPPAELLERVSKQVFDILPKDIGTVWRLVPGSAGEKTLRGSPGSSTG
jgi:hypothetical protein